MNRKDVSDSLPFPGSFVVRLTKLLKTLRLPIFLGLLGCLFLLTSCAPTPGVTFFSSHGKVHVATEVADTNQARSQGLMFRETLNENAGMLFVFDEEAPRTFWMKNTLIPLDIIFVDSELTVVSIIENAQPCKEDPCQIYPSIEPAQYVIETNAGFAKLHVIRVGDTVEIRT